MGWKTYLVMYFGTGNGKPSDIAKKLESMGFTAAFGTVDFIYDWGEREPTKEEVLNLADQITERIKESGAVFNLDTHD